ncbi:TniQ family protein [Fictibacillus phosphorivorans]|uniref:TniQ family protein n=1 Tax=Fictibacillus phosphorivorans TaxID=1221500 RepID=UPI00203E704D|nr:TniQ family protein [Fictibacillus phosphorivorans]MCM3719430.1 TniQ family protein [Fictibacillus phosphorivorans]MCM3777092.1 TniQ family protein [Fictibacillus phosphorivorans]
MFELPIKVNPFSDESLLSYLMRVSKGNHINLISFLNNEVGVVKNIQASELRVININPTIMIDIEKWKKFSRQSSDPLRMTFYYGLVNFTPNNDLTHSRFFSSIFTDTLKFCPLCLKDQKYYRLLWEIDEMNICLKHQIALNNQCDKCVNSIDKKVVHKIGFCPHCNADLSKQKVNLMESNIKKQMWIYHFFKVLLEEQLIYLSPEKVALKLLFLMNGFETKFNRTYIKNKISKNKLANLLQVSRNSLSQKRIVHLQTLIDILYTHNITINEFINMKVPKEFINTILCEKVPKYKKNHCLAQWCEFYKKEGSLVKTGVSLRRQTNGEVLKYYMFCSSCGCEYAFNAMNELVERTNFISIYKKIKMVSNKEYSFSQLSDLLNLTREKLRRVMAFFRTRIPLNCDPIPSIEIKKNQLDMFIKLVSKGSQIKDIQTMKCWSSYDEFLTYRYHIQAICSSFEYDKPKEYISEKEFDKKETLIILLNEMYELDNDITLSNICKELKVSTETLRNWGFKEIIKEFKDKQKNYRMEKLKEEIYSKVDKYFEITPEPEITSKSLYQYINISRSILWRKNPQLTNYISYKLDTQKHALQH